MKEALVVYTQAQWQARTGQARPSRNGVFPRTLSTVLPGSTAT